MRLNAFVLAAGLALHGALFPATSAAGQNFFSGTPQRSILGVASISEPRGIESLAANPAGLAYPSLYEIYAGRNFWAVETSQDLLVLKLPGSKGFGAALGGDYVNLGDFEARDRLGNLEGAYRSFRYAASGGVARQFLDGRVALGLGLRNSFLTLRKTVVTGYGADLGALAPLPGSFALGAVAGLGMEDNSKASPALSLGLALSKAFGPEESRFRLLGGAHMELGGFNKVNLGAEYLRGKWLALAAGYEVALGPASSGQGSPAFGVVLGAKTLSFHYALKLLDELGAANQAGLSFRFEGSKPVTPEEKAARSAEAATRAKARERAEVKKDIALRQAWFFEPGFAVALPRSFSPDSTLAAYAPLAPTRASASSVPEFGAAISLGRQFEGGWLLSGSLRSHASRFVEMDSSSLRIRQNVGALSVAVEGGRRINGNAKGVLSVFGILGFGALHGSYSAAIPNLSSTENALSGNTVVVGAGAGISRILGPRFELGAKASYEVMNFSSSAGSSNPYDYSGVRIEAGMKFWTSKSYSESPPVESGRPEEAQVLTPSAQPGVPSREAQVARIQEALKAMDWPLAEARLLELGPGQPPSASYWKNLGFVRYKSGRIPAAIDAYQRALETDSQDEATKKFLDSLRSQEPHE